MKIVKLKLDNRFKKITPEEYKTQMKKYNIQLIKGAYNGQ